jgi:hypothetical protein
MGLLGILKLRSPEAMEPIVNTRRERKADGKEAEMDASVIVYSGIFVDLYFYDRSAGKRGEGIVF